jgi:ABC-type thiamin/hydroxymethylpyrimidine transport system permease subunit
MPVTRRYMLSTKDLVTIALLSALGGVLSTYVGYLGNLMNHIVGVPFGAGQFMAGLHVLWIILAIGITKKRGAGTVTGALKGVVELFTGSTHGVVIVVVSLIQGAVADLVLFSDKAKGRRDYVSFSAAGGLSAATNVIIFQALFFAGVPWILILMLCMLACASGMVFGGWLSVEMLETLEDAGVVGGKKEIFVDQRSAEDDAWKRSRQTKRRRLVSLTAVASFLTVFTLGAVYYFMFVFVMPGGDTISIQGDVENPFDFRYSDFEDQEVVVNAELIGTVTHVPPRDYTGIPLRTVLNQAEPRESVSEVVVTGRDGYYIVFEFSSVMGDDGIIIVNEDGSFRLVADEYEGGYWVEGIVAIEVR